MIAQPRQHAVPRATYLDIQAAAAEQPQEDHTELSNDMPVVVRV